jgi:hypothetical protein
VLPNDIIDEPLWTRFGVSRLVKLPIAPRETGVTDRFDSRDSSNRGEKEDGIEELCVLARAEGELVADLSLIINDRSVSSLDMSRSLLTWLGTLI